MTERISRTLPCNSFAELLNIKCTSHFTVFVVDGKTEGDLAGILVGTLGNAATKVLVVPVGTSPSGFVENVLSAMRSIWDASADVVASSYFSFQLLVREHRSLGIVRRALGTFPRRDVARLEMPPSDILVAAEDLKTLVDVVITADYAHQRTVSERIYRALELSDPYRIDCLTAGGARLSIEDQKPLFDLSGPLQDGDDRILPGGEVAYTGKHINGSFVVHGGLLATATSGRGIELSRQVTALSKLISEDPVTFRIEAGHVIEATSEGAAAVRLLDLMPLPKYAEITEVGFSFNRACREVNHRWPASSNEGVPGIHVAMGGDPEGGVADPDVTVHVDFIAPGARLIINSREIDLS